MRIFVRVYDSIRTYSYSKRRLLIIFTSILDPQSSSVLDPHMEYPHTSDIDKFLDHLSYTASHHDEQMMQFHLDIFRTRIW